MFQPGAGRCDLEPNTVKTVERAMSVRKLTASMLTILVMLGGITSVNAIDHQPVMVDPFEFDPDFQWFEPVTNMDLADMKPKKRTPTGWFATYDRLNLYGSRPESDQQERLETLLDSGWGHRYEIGYMLPGADTGWTFNWTDMGVHVGERVGPKLNPEFFLGIPISGLPILSGVNWINDYEYDSYELNRTWRMEPYHYGGILEPMIGLRYMKIKDRNRFQDYLDPLPDAPDTDFGTIVSDLALTRNDMFGGQIGFRYFKSRDRFTFSTDFKAFAGGSWQASRSQRTIIDLELFDFEQGPNGEGPPDGIRQVPVNYSPPILSRNDEAFIGFDIHTELAYQVSRYVTIRAGVQVIDVARGVWRGGDGSLGSLEAGDQNQDIFMVGGTFGLSLNH